MEVDIRPGEGILEIPPLVTFLNKGGVSNATTLLERKGALDDQDPQFTTLLSISIYSRSKVDPYLASQEELNQALKWVSAQTQLPSEERKAEVGLVEQNLITVFRHAQENTEQILLFKDSDFDY